MDVDEGQCGVFLEDLDFEGNTIEWIEDTSKEDCVEICKDFAGCTAIASNPFNDCVLKDVDSETFATVDEGRYVYRLCPEESVFCHAFSIAVVVFQRSSSVCATVSICPTISLHLLRAGNLEHISCLSVPTCPSLSSST